MSFAAAAAKQNQDRQDCASLARKVSRILKSAGIEKGSYNASSYGIRKERGFVVKGWPEMGGVAAVVSCSDSEDFAANSASIEKALLDGGFSVRHHRNCFEVREGERNG